jgi:hypothetical protein
MDSCTARIRKRETERATATARATSFSSVALLFAVVGCNAASGGGGQALGGRSGSVGGLGGAPAAGTGGQVSSGAGGGSTSTVDGGGGRDVVVADETLCGDVALADTRTVAAGTTLTICAGSTLTAAPGVSLHVLGRLQIQGTAALPVKLAGSSAEESAWTGIAVDAGGDLSATYLEIHDAEIALSARPGATYAIDHLVIDDSATMLALASDGTIAHGTLRGLGDRQGGSPVYVAGAAPHITDTSITQGSYGSVDMIIIYGAGAAPVFDHVEVADAHCAFHIGNSSGAVFSNSWFHHNSYAFMLGDSIDGQVTHNNFEGNDINLGSCGGGAMLVSDNFFQGAPFDDSCAALSVTGITPPAAYATGVGPRP